MNPRTEAMAFRIWAYASAREWDCTSGEIAAHLGIRTSVVGAICRHRGWLSRMRHDALFVGVYYNPQQAGMVYGFDGPPRLARGDMDALRPAAVLQ